CQNEVDRQINAEVLSGENCVVGSRTNTIPRRAEKSSDNRFPGIEKNELGAIFQGTVKTCVFLLYLADKCRIAFSGAFVLLPNWCSLRFFRLFTARRLYFCSPRL
ncbi:MAG: hypothetical protein J6W70_01280, partial [Lentisphaeria bacterium]|nr:hypothetical protein [Lentisphaeria bacterium]